ncbi:Serine proteinase stubble [Trachymyrmex septentrionalis]|uniref:Serine proteinase stubble n=1 Tax=Trachymyrmex septentrionalis TaxID=34720 RepID=A0A195EXL5_9HYME|nr:PREDICTED: proclotting enzyme-like isoform X1 [Trachymyrmex septentrionalis]KYN32968.1 Serine proteinase stubble [Trachymyrmex septentrionalis]
MDTSRPRHWLLATVILSLSSSLMTSEIEQFTKYDSSVVNMRRDETNHTEGVVAIRRRRYVRFPTGSAYLLETGSTPHGRNFGPHPVTRFIPQTQFPGSWRQHKSFWRTPSDYNRPVMSHRTPRLIFRDNDFLPPVGGSATSFFQQSNQLPDFEDDIRDLRKQMPDDYPRLETEMRQHKRPLWKGDDTLCADGRSCEFFLMCWMTAGLLDGSCGGIMYACCQRKDPTKALTDYNLIESPRDQSRPLPLDLYTETDSGDRCGIPIVSKQIAQRRIVGGDEAGFGSFPWQAYIRIGSSRCGGTLVNRFHVVTAGHCVAKASARQVQVTLGDYVVNSATESLPAYTFGVREIRVHPYFKFTPQADRFDVAVLRLDRPVHYMPHIGPICLPEKNEDFLGQYGWAAGWGALQAGSRLRPKTLQAVDVPVIDNRLCERWHRSNGINVVIHDEMMCAGYRSGGKDSCQGDSGGPLMLEKTGRWYLIGIVSAGYSCAQPGQPGIYHRVAKTVDWITYVINS